MSTLIEKNFRLLISLGVRLSPSSAEVFSSTDGPLHSESFRSRAVHDQIHCLEVAIAQTESVFSGEVDSLKPRIYSSPISFSGKYSCVGHEAHQDPDCHVNLLVQELAVLSGAERLEKHRSGGNKALVLLGVISTSSLIRLIEQEKPGLICCIFRQDKDWSSWVCSRDLQAFKNLLLQHNIVFRALPSKAMKHELFSLLRDELFGFVGSTLLVANLSDSEVCEIVKSFHKDFLNGLRARTGGPCMDEFMMLFHTYINYSRCNFNLLSNRKFPGFKPLIVVGSGPSLDRSLSVLRAIREDCIVISAGSSIGTLMRSGIYPDVHVHVERGDSGELRSVYGELLDELGFVDFGHTVGVLPTSIEPELPGLYKRVLMYGRSGQTPVIAWPAVEPSLLKYEGPECLSAAFAFAMHLCPKHVFLFGCDLGSVDGSADRSANAVGHSSRDFMLPVLGNFVQTAFTNSQMLLQLSYMKAACSACRSSPEVFNLSDGIRLPFAKPLRLKGLRLSDLVTDAVDHNIDELYDAISAPGLGACPSPIGASEIADAKQFLDQWLVLAEQAPSMSRFAVRLQASRLLSARRFRHCELVYKLFRGSLRDAFWLTSFAVEHYCEDTKDVEYCWGCFSRFLRGLLFEIKAIPSWLGSCD